MYDEELIIIPNMLTIINVIKVPPIPKNKMYPKFSKKCFALKVYPAAKIIGGNIKLKNICSSNLIYAAVNYKRD
jgi:hypothetical protein